MKIPYWCIALVMTAVLTGCFPEQNKSGSKTIASDGLSSTGQHLLTETVIPPESPTHAIDLIPHNSGPLLLIQTDVDTYQILDVFNQTATDFQPPAKNQNYDLAKNLSPSGSQIFFQINSQEVILMSLNSGKIETMMDAQSDLSVFDPKQAAEEARNLLPGINYSEEGMQAAVMNAWENSKLNTQWYQSDQNHLFVLTTSETSTNLFMNDAPTGRHEQLENMPGLVEQFWVGPDKDLILIKKGFLFEPEIWQEDAYYLIDQYQDTVQPISMPEDVENPSVFWFSADFIGINHQPSLGGGENFSLVDVVTMERTQIIMEPFNRLFGVGPNLLTLHHGPDMHSTTLTLRSLDGQIIQNQKINELCFLRTALEAHLLLFNCETESVLIEGETLAASHYGDPVGLVSWAPSRNMLVLIAGDHESVLLNADLQKLQDLSLQRDPLEIRWLPDSSGFLYRTANQLYHYDLASETSHLLVTSDFFGDYRNLNAVWLKLD